MGIAQDNRDILLHPNRPLLSNTECVSREARREAEERWPDRKHSALRVAYIFICPQPRTI